MKTLNKILLYGTFLFSPLMSSNINNLKKYLPLEEKLREIETSPHKIPSNVCMHKAFRYYINAKKAGEDAHLVTGWRTNSKVWYAWVAINKNGRVFYIDPSYNDSNNDGMPKEFFTDRKEIRTFDSNVSIKDFVYNKKIQKQNNQTIKQYCASVTDFIPAKTELRTSLIKSIENYCKEDTLAWEYYRIIIANDK